MKKLSKWVVPACALALGVGVVTLTNDASAMPRSVGEALEYAYWYYFLR